MSHFGLGAKYDRLNTVTPESSIQTNDSLRPAPQPTSVLDTTTFVVSGMTQPRSPSSIAWSPHNLLAVATGTEVHLYRTTLAVPASTIRILQDRVLLRSAPIYDASGGKPCMPLIQGLQWSSRLGREGEHYPCSALLSVYVTQQGSQDVLLVYAVSRQGDDKSEHFAKVVCTAPLVVDLWPFGKRQLERLTHERLDIPAPSGRKRATKVIKRERRDWSDDDDYGEDSEGVKDVQVSEEQYRARRFPVSMVDYFWLPNRWDTLLVVTYLGVHVLEVSEALEMEELLMESTKTRSEKKEKKVVKVEEDEPSGRRRKATRKSAPPSAEEADDRLRPFPPPLYRFTDPADGGHDPISPIAPCTVCRVQPLPRSKGVSAPSGTATESSPWRSENSTGFVIASPLVLRVMEVFDSSSSSGGYQVVLHALIKVPQLTAYPSCLYVAETLLPSTGRVGLRVLVAAAGVAWRGCFPVLRESTPDIVTLWSLEQTYELEKLGGSDPFVRAFAALPLDGFLGTFCPYVAAAGAESHSLRRPAPFVVVGYSRQNIYLFSLTDQTPCRVVFQTAVLRHARHFFTLPSDVAGSVVAVTFHSSAALAVVLLDRGDAAHTQVLQPLLGCDGSNWFSAALQQLFPLHSKGWGSEVTLPLTPSPVEVLGPEQNPFTPGTPSGTRFKAMAGQLLEERLVDPHVMTLLWNGMSSLSHLSWEPIAPAKNSDFVFYPLRQTRQRYFFGTTSFLWNVRRNQKIEKKPTGGLSASPGTRLNDLDLEQGHIARAVRLAEMYLCWRQALRTELFLRYPKSLAPFHDDHFYRTFPLCEVESHYLLHCPSSREGTPKPEPLEAQASMLHVSTEVPTWRAVLIALTRLCPSEIFLIRNELLLAQAVHLLACEMGFAGMTLSEPLFFQKADRVPGTEGDSTGVAFASPHARSADGALGFVLLYRDWLQQCGEKRDHSTDVESSFTRNAFIRLWLADWSSWAEALDTFLQQCTGQKTSELRDAIQHNPESGAMQFVRTKFPCSMCEEPGVAALTLVLRSSSFDPHGSEASPSSECHTSVFSPTTFGSVPLFSSESVVGRCPCCGLTDFVLGALCQLCGGVLL